MDDAKSVPAPLRQTAFQAAVVALADALIAGGYPLDPFAQLELMDLELDRLENAFDDSPARTH